MEIKKLDVPENVSGLLQEYNKFFLADESLTDSDVLLLTIYLIENTQKFAGAKYEDCKKIFINLGRKENSFQVCVHRGKKQSLIEQREGKLFFLISGLKKLRNFIGQIGKSPVHIIKSGQNFTAIKLLEEFLQNEIRKEEILLCDSHVSPSTLYPFSVLLGRIKKIKILTANIFDHVKLEEYKKKLEKEMNISIEIKENKKIHDRYLICGDSCWHIGASIKDLGNKDTIIKDISEVFDSMTNLFNERWQE